MIVLLHTPITPDTVPTCLDPVNDTGHTLCPLVAVLFFLILEYCPRVDNAQQEVEDILSY